MQRLTLFVSFVFFSCLTINSQAKYFFSIEQWYIGTKKGGEIRVHLTIMSIDENVAKVLIKKEMTPFSQIVEFTTDAEVKSDKYYFTCLDNWSNEVSGYFYFDKIQIVLYLDCTKYSDLGKNVARLYGDTAILTAIPYE